MWSPTSLLLLLAAGKLTGKLPRFPSKPKVFTISPTKIGIDCVCRLTQSVHNIFVNIQNRNEIIVLKPRTQYSAGGILKLFVRHPVQFMPLHNDISAGGLIKTAEHMQQRTLTGARLPNHGNKFPVSTVKFHRREREPYSAPFHNTFSVHGFLIMASITHPFRVFYLTWEILQALTAFTIFLTVLQEHGEGRILVWLGIDQNITSFAFLKSRRPGKGPVRPRLSFSRSSPVEPFEDGIPFFGRDSTPWSVKLIFV